MKKEKGKRIIFILFCFVVLGIIILGYFYLRFYKNSHISAAPSSQTYTACGCGCCGGTTPLEQCLYHAKGDDLNKIVQADKNLQSSNSCASLGCSSGIKYRYCD